MELTNKFVNEISRIISVIAKCKNNYLYLIICTHITHCGQLENHNKEINALSSLFDCVINSIEDNTKNEKLKTYFENIDPYIKNKNIDFIIMGGDFNFSMKNEKYNKLFKKEYLLTDFSTINNNRPTIDHIFFYTKSNLSKKYNAINFTQNNEDIDMYNKLNINHKLIGGKIIFY